MYKENKEESAADLDPELLKGIFLFRSVNIESIQGIFEFCKIRRLQAGEILFPPGQANWTIYFVLEGKLRIHLNTPAGEPVAILGPGESVGELSVIDRQPTTAYAVADEDSRLLVMDEEILWSLVHSSHAIACNLLYTLAKRLRHADAVVCGESRLDQEERNYGNVDALTGMPTREWFTELTRRQVARSQHCQKPLSLLLIDIDGFRAFNDRYGRRCGDRILYAMAAALSRHLRPTEIIARYGSDQFFIMLPDTDMETAKGIAVRIFKIISQATPVMVEGKVVDHPSVSVGVVQMKSGQDTDALLAEAEAAVARAKESGGNSVSA